MNNNPFEEANPVTLDQMLDARENRAALQRQLLKKYAAPLICFTLNIPGEYKVYPLSKKAFREGCHLIARQLERGGIGTLFYQEIDKETGLEGYYVVEADAGAVKALLIEIEEGHPLGRLFDMDVLNSDGRGLHGTEIGRGERQCIVCGGPVWECSRSRAHSAEQLAARTAGIFDDYFSRQYADKIGGMAVRALLYEVNVTPKPGLVDRANNGAHRDMDIFTFLDSSCALIPYFRDITLQGLRFQGEPEKLLATLRYTGQCAEDTMFFATKGVNTHKGLIFSLGLICAAMGYLYGRDQPQTVDILLQLCARIAGDTPEELNHGAAFTYGQLAYMQYGLTGIRGEAAAGFPNVRDYGYPVLEAMMEQGCSINNAGVVALLHLMAHVTDTNMINRSDLETLHSVQTQVVRLLSGAQKPEELLQIARELDGQLIAWNLSPGGCADLLGVSMMLLCIAKEV